VARRKSDDQKVRGFFKFFIIVVFVVFLIYVISNRMVYFLTHAEILKVDEVVKAPSLQFIQSRHLDRLIGINIFRIDLEGVQRRVQEEYPSVDRLRVIRQLPNRILVSAEKREPFVIVAVGSRDVVLDEKGIIFGAEPPAKGQLPYLRGIVDNPEIKDGHSLSSRRVSVGLDIVRCCQTNEYLQKFSVNSIDLTNLSKIYLDVNNIEVILDRFEIEQKINTLGLLLSDTGISPDQINYLDLRFKEPIIKKK
jgi:cell division septal protein FtsQ